MTTMNESEPWCFTVVRTQGMRLMRPEKSWRPIITVEIDQHHCHETVMGVDGQNPNLKERFELHQAHVSSKVDIRVWHRSQSKKKGKRRNLVASASHSLGELIRQQEKEPRAELELRLQCQSATKKAISSKGRPQNGATLLLKIHPPAEALRKLNLIDLTDKDEWEAGSLSEGESSTRVPESPSMPPSPTDDTWPDMDPPTSLRHRRKGYHLNSDDEIYSASEDEDDPSFSKPLIFSDGESYCDEDITLLDDPCPPDSIIRVSASGPRDWIHTIFPSLAILPQYTERIEIPPNLNFAERVLASFTTYSALKAARSEAEYERVFSRLQLEWTYVGGLLVALAAVSTAVFSISPGSIFEVESYARSAIAASSVSSGLGIACDAWFLLRYNWADLHTFKTRARDVYASYFFFALSARVPALCLFVSALTLMLFLGLVAFEVWPIGVLLTCFAIGFVMTLQFLVFGAQWCVLRLIGAVRWVWRICGRVFTLGSGSSAASVVKEEGGKVDEKEKA